MAELVMTYTINPVWAFIKKVGKSFMESQARLGKARAAQHLAAMGYYEEAKRIMLEK